LVAEGTAFLAKGAPDEARKRYAQALALEPADAERSRVASLIAVTFAMAGAFNQKACDAWSQKHLTAKRLRAYVVLAAAETPCSEGRWVRAQELAESIADQDTPAGGAARRLVALCEERLGAPRRAAAPHASDPLTAADIPSNVAVQKVLHEQLVKQGRRSLKSGQIDNARHRFARAVMVTPETETSCPIAVQFVKTFKRDNRYDAAACRTRAAELLDPFGRDRVELALGECYYRDRRLDEAIEVLTPLTAKQGMIGESAELIIALSVLAQGDSETATARLRELSERATVEGIRGKSLFLVGWSQLQKQDYTGARQTFKDVVKKFPETPYSRKAAELVIRLQAFEDVE
jgi:tetratricopeptide (TPR) repeat protein